MALHQRKNGSNLALDSNYESTTHLPGIKHSRVSSNTSHAEFEKAVNEARTQTSKFLMTTVSPSVKLTSTQHQIKKALSSHIHDSTSEYRFDEKGSIRTPKGYQMSSMHSQKDTPYYGEEKPDSAMMISEFASPKHYNSHINESIKSKSSIVFSPRNGDPSQKIAAQNDLIVKLKKELNEKNVEITNLKQKILDMPREVNRSITNKSMMALDYEALSSLNVYDLQREDSPQLHQILLALVSKSFELMKILNERCIGLARVMGQLEHSSTKGLSESDFFKLREGMDELLSTLVETSKNELELGIKTRELEKKNHEISRLKNDNQKLQDNYRHMSDENAELKRLKIDLQQKLHMSELEKEQLKIQNQESTKKINTLEKRVSLMLEVDYSSNNDEMRKALGELVKDNEELKRKLNGKVNELKRANEEINRAKTKVTRQNRKIENLTKKKGAPSDDFATLMQSNTDLNLLQLGNLPSSLDFRTSSLKFHYAELLNDIMEQGPLVFIDQLHKLNSVKDQDEAIHFVVNQLISYKEFGERLHLFMKQSYEIFKLKHIEELMVYLNKYTKQIFTCEQVHLWCPDRATGIFFTIEQTKSEIRCLSTKGLISEVLKNNKAFNKRNMKTSFVCELTTAEGKYKTDQTLIFPLKSHGDKIVGVLEISNIIDSHFGFDEEYLGLALSQLLSRMIARIHEEEALESVNKMKNMIHEALVSLCSVDNLTTFTHQVKEWSLKIFGVSTVGLVFIENETFVNYTNANEIKKQSVTVGLSGEAYQKKRGIICPDVSSNKDFNSLIDLKSSLPIYFCPAILKKPDGKTIINAIFQVAIKSSRNKKEESITQPESIVGHVGLDDPFEVLADTFSQIIAIAISVFHEKYTYNRNYERED